MAIELKLTLLTPLEIRALKREYNRVKDTKAEVAGMTLEQWVHYEAGTTLRTYIETHIAQMQAETSTKEVALPYITATLEVRNQVRALLGLPPETELPPE